MNTPALAAPETAAPVSAESTPSAPAVGPVVSTPRQQDAAAAAPKLTISQILSAAIASKAGLQAQVETLTADLTGLRAEHGTLSTEAVQLRSQVSALTGERDTLRAEVERYRQEAKATGDQVTEVLAELGFPAASLPGQQEGSVPKTREELIKEYNAIQDPSTRAKFYADHLR